MMVSIFSNKVFLTKVSTFFRHNAIDCTLNTLQNSVSITCVCTEKLKGVGDSLHCDIALLWWSRMEPAISPRYVCTSV